MSLNSLRLFVFAEITVHSKFGSWLLQAVSYYLESSVNCLVVAGLMNAHVSYYCESTGSLRANCCLLVLWLPDRFFDMVALVWTSVHFFLRSWKKMVNSWGWWMRRKTCQRNSPRAAVLCTFINQHVFDRHTIQNFIHCRYHSDRLQLYECINLYLRSCNRFI